MATTLTTSGSVGIGTTDPQYDLDVYGNINYSGIFYKSGARYESTLNTSLLSVGTISTSVLPNSGVSAGTYGSSTSVPVMTVDAKGRITSVTTELSASNPWTISGVNLHYNSGNIGIGTTNPLAKLTVSGGMSLGTAYSAVTPPADGLVVVGNIGIGTTNPLARVHIFSTMNADLFRLDDDTMPDTTPFLIDRNGNVGIGVTNPTNKLEVAGGIVASGDIAAFGSVSDARLKESLEVPQDVLAKIMELKPVEYTWNNNVFVEDKRGKRDVGFIAQDIDNVFPLVTRSLKFPNVDTEFKGINYEKLVPYLVKAIQELSEKVHELQLQLTC